MKTFAYTAILGLATAISLKDDWAHCGDVEAAVNVGEVDGWKEDAIAAGAPADFTWDDILNEYDFCVAAGVITPPELAQVSLG